MTYGAFSFNSPSAPDQTATAGLAQYAGQMALAPNQGIVAATNPIAAAGQFNLAKALQEAQRPTLPAQQLPQQVAQTALAAGAQVNPNVGGQNTGGVGPTQQNAALAQALMTPQLPMQPTNTQQFMMGGN